MNGGRRHHRAVGIIPARYRASRFPGKLLARLGGRTVIEWVYSRAAAARSLDGVLVAADDERIVREVESFGGKAVMTSTEHRSGTERIAEVCAGEGPAAAAEVVVNIQGDEPFIRGEMIDRVVEELFRFPELDVVSLKKRIDSESEMENPDIVKTVTDRMGFALYFSRYPVPYHASGPTPARFKHIGLYGYRKKFLAVFTSLPPGEMERSEKLEQLRILENGYKIKLIETEWETVGIDSPRDLEQAAGMLTGPPRREKT